MFSEPTPTDEVSTQVIDAVAAATDTDPLSIDPPLFEAIDPDALDTIISAHSTVSQIQFEFAGCLVTVAGDGTVTADRQTVDSDGGVATTA